MEIDASQAERMLRKSRADQALSLLVDRDPALGEPIDLEAVGRVLHAWGKSSHQRGDITGSFVLEIAASCVLIVASKIEEAAEEEKAGLPPPRNVARRRAYRVVVYDGGLAPKARRARGCSSPGRV